MATLTSILARNKDTPFQRWVLQVFRAVYVLPRWRKRPPELTLQDVVYGLVGKDCDEDLVKQIVYLAEHSLVDSHQVGPFATATTLGGSVHEVGADLQSSHFSLRLSD